ncbi:hypothetical protein BCR34DRAFT_134420 [Clohesyomyces aquaticus]|uniref:Uncharacterized protein n=1 Tax=Clohesyomyces aquaticus TaxID=1231657 RepID=A0A1Y2AAN1_9PLEO|nr:hypothetical protein BCR34DRAFT_134420 [Clohesyomyces aquaticus]
MPGYYSTSPIFIRPPFPSLDSSSSASSISILTPLNSLASTPATSPSDSIGSRSDASSEVGFIGKNRCTDSLSTARSHSITARSSILESINSKTEEERQQERESCLTTHSTTTRPRQRQHQPSASRPQIFSRGIRSTWSNTSAVRRPWI